MPMSLAVDPTITQLQREIDAQDVLIDALVIELTATRASRDRLQQELRTRFAEEGAAYLQVLRAMVKGEQAIRCGMRRTS